MDGECHVINVPIAQASHTGVLSLHGLRTLCDPNSLCWLKGFPPRKDTSLAGAGARGKRRGHSGKCRTRLGDSSPRSLTFQPRNTLARLSRPRVFTCTRGCLSPPGSRGTGIGPAESGGRKAQKNGSAWGGRPASSGLRACSVWKGDWNTGSHRRVLKFES